eukprot:788615-Alexandrium_andersonii.AAC.1
MRDLQQGLGLQLAASYVTNWVRHQWSQWQSFATDAQMPPGMFIRSHSSVAAKRRRHGEEFEAPSMQEFMVSTAMMLALLCRWRATLHGGGRQGSLDMLGAILQRTLPDSELMCYLKGARACCEPC